MNPETSQKPIKRQPIDWVVWSTWVILFVGLGISGLLIHRRSLGQIEVWVPVKDLSAYHLIVDTDVMKTTEAIASLPADVLSVNTSPVGVYTIQTVNSNHVLSLGNLAIPSDIQLTVDTIPVSIPATATMIFNGQIRSETVIDVWLVHSDNVAGNAKSELILQRAFVLDVQQVQNIEGDESYPYTVVLAVPTPDVGDLIAASSSGSLSFTIVH